MSKLLALLTDFGTTDSYVGVMKGVMKRITPNLEFIDITHAIRPQSVREGAWTLKHSYRYFPPQTVFLVVVDPGVGSKRRPVLVEAGNYKFIAPDNGVLSYALSELDIHRIIELNNPRYSLPDVSATFHGRDIFAPVAAHVAGGLVPSEDFGTPLTELFRLSIPPLHIQAHTITGEVTHIDHFGNIITNIGVLQWLGEDRMILQPENGEPVRITASEAHVRIHGRELRPLAHAYHEAARGEFLAQVDSNGYLEIAINQGNAAERLDAAIGDIVELHF